MPRQIDWNERPLRSLLFTPGNHPRRLQRVADFGSDAIVLDLEDAVADDEKEAARGTAHAALSTYDERQIVFVRVNSWDTGRLQGDVAGVVGPDLDAIIVPKLESPDVLPRVDALIAEAERAQGLEVGRIRLLGLIETAKGLIRAEEICAQGTERLHTVAFGLGDFSVDIGVDLTLDATELLYARSKIVIAARAAGLAPPIEGPWLRLEDVDGLVADTLRSRQLGYQGRVVVYPPQVEHVQRAYSDMPEEEARAARAVVEQFDKALAEGLASIRVEGRFIDYPLYYRAKHKLKLYDALHASA